MLAAYLLQPPTVYYTYYHTGDGTCGAVVWSASVRCWSRYSSLAFTLSPLTLSPLTPHPSPLTSHPSPLTPHTPHPTPHQVRSGCSAPGGVVALSVSLCCSPIRRRVAWVCPTEITLEIALQPMVAEAVVWRRGGRGGRCGGWGGGHPAPLVPRPLCRLAAQRAARGSGDGVAILPTAVPHTSLNLRCGLGSGRRAA